MRTRRPLLLVITISVGVLVGVPAVALAAPGGPRQAPAVVNVAHQAALASASRTVRPRWWIPEIIAPQCR